MLNVCMVGYGMMRAWPVLHTPVGRRAEPARKFAECFGYIPNELFGPPHT
jgi:hypothetical protein